MERRKKTSRDIIVNLKKTFRKWMKFSKKAQVENSHSNKNVSKMFYDNFGQICPGKSHPDNWTKFFSIHHRILDIFTKDTTYDETFTLYTIQSVSYVLFLYGFQTMTISLSKRASSVTNSGLVWRNKTFLEPTLHQRFQVFVVDI